MAPSALVSILIFALTFLHPGTSLCAPRSGPYYTVLASNNHPSPPTAAPVSSPAPSPRTSPSPSPSPSPSTSTSTSPSTSSPSTSSPSTAGPLDTIIDTVSQAINSFQSAPLQHVCSKAKHPDICVATIQSITFDLNNLDDHTVLRELVSAIIPIIKEAKQKADSLPKDLKAKAAPAPRSDAPDYAGNASALSVCIRGLGEAIDSIETVPIYLQEGSYSATARTNLDSFVNNIRLCTDEDTPIKDDATKIYQMYENCMSLFDSIWPDSSSAYLFPGQGA